MTYQLILFRENAVVIASDTQTTFIGEQKTVEDDKVCSTYRPISDHASKIIQQNGIICTFAGDTYSKDIAQSVLKEVSGRQLSEQIIKDVWGKVTIPPHQEKLYRKIMFVEGDKQEFRIWLAVLDPRREAKSLTIQCLHRGVHSKIRERFVFAGDEYNPARYLAEQFYKNYYNQNGFEPAPLSRLKKLAAHVVLTAGKFNSALSGLAMIVGNNGTFQEISENEINFLTDLSKTIHDNANGLLNGPDFGTT